jgi:hypothetical protein
MVYKVFAALYRKIHMYKVFAALKEDSNEGWIWLRQPSVPQRSVVKITNCGNGKSIYCEALQFDKNFLRYYNQSGGSRIPITDPDHSIVINKWYRSRLGDFATQSEQNLHIVAQDHWWGRCWACLHHPQVGLRLATWLGVLGFVLGVVGVILGVLSVL